jgi:hypothetical protein
MVNKRRTATQVRRLCCAARYRSAVRTSFAEEERAMKRRKGERKGKMLFSLIFPTNFLRLLSLFFLSEACTFYVFCCSYRFVTTVLSSFFVSQISAFATFFFFSSPRFSFLFSVLFMCVYAFSLSHARSLSIHLLSVF